MVALDEHGRERHHRDNTGYNPKHCGTEYIITIDHGLYTKSNDGDREQARTSYKKMVSTTCQRLKKKLNTERHHTSEPE